MNKLRANVSNALGVIGTLLILGSAAVWFFGPEMLTWIYERTKPILPFLLAGFGLIVLSCMLAPASKGDSSPHAACKKCNAMNDVRAKFCDQCGNAIAAPDHPNAQGIQTTPRDPAG